MYQCLARRSCMLGCQDIKTLKSEIDLICSDIRLKIEGVKSKSSSLLLGICLILNIIMFVYLKQASKILPGNNQR